MTNQTAPPPEPQAGGLSNLQVRTRTALALLPIFLICLYLDGWLWVALALVMAVVGAVEFYALAHGRPHRGMALAGVPAVIAVVVSFKLEEPLLSIAALVTAGVLALVMAILQHGNARRAITQAAVTLGGILYVAFPAGFLVEIRHMDKGLMWLLVIVTLTWGTDTFAYFGGRQWGKHKLARRISPKKTVEGAVVGVIGGIIPATLILIITDSWSLTAQMMILAGPFVAIAGDLFESALKRYYGIKDSSVPGLNIIPGHGGVLDRIDALLFVSVLCYTVIQLADLT